MMKYADANNTKQIQNKHRLNTNKMKRNTHGEAVASRPAVRGYLFDIHLVFIFIYSTFI